MKNFNFFEKQARRGARAAQWPNRPVGGHEARAAECNEVWRSLSEKLPYITADDWGISPGVNEGILKLVERGLISRVSLMADAPFLERHLKELRKNHHLQLGLHFNLTHRKKFTSPTHFAIHWFFHRKNQKQWVRNELYHQLTHLKKLNLPIHYFDSHQHVHILPGFFYTIHDILKSENIFQVRIPLDWSLWKTSKCFLIPLSLLTRLSAQKLQFHTLKFYYPPLKLFHDPNKLWMKLQQNSDHEVLVHPALSDDFDSLNIPDSYRQGRRIEFEALMKLSYSAFKQQK